MIVDSSSDTFFSMRPEIEVGRNFEGLHPGQVFRPFVKFGQTYVLDGRPSITARFEGTPDGISPFTVEGDFADHSTDYTLGLRIFNESGAMIRIEGLLETIGTTDIYEANIKFSFPF